MEITKTQAIKLLATVYDSQRQTVNEVAETDNELVQRIRNAMRERYNTRVDERLKKQAIQEHYRLNPEDQEVVASLD